MRRAAGNKHQPKQEGQKKGGGKGGAETNSAKAQDTKGRKPAAARNNWGEKKGKKANRPTRRGNPCPEGAKQSGRTKPLKER